MCACREVTRESKKDIKRAKMIRDAAERAHRHLEVKDKAITSEVEWRLQVAEQLVFRYVYSEDLTRPLSEQLILRYFHLKHPLRHLKDSSSGCMFLEIPHLDTFRAAFVHMHALERPDWLPATEHVLYMCTRKATLRHLQSSSFVGMCTAKPHSITFLPVT